MQIAEKKKKYTVADYQLLEEGAPFQLINYDLIMSPSPNSYHQLVSGEIFFFIKTFLNNTNDSGLVISAPMDVVLDDGNVYQPDIIYISEKRKNQLVKERIEGAPDLVIEILSPSTGYYDLRYKKDIYERYGVKEYIIIDPMKETAESYFLTDGVYQLKQEVSKPNGLNSVLLPGLTLALDKLFK